MQYDVRHLLTPILTGVLIVVLLGSSFQNFAFQEAFAATLTVTGAQPSASFAGGTASYTIQFTTATTGMIGKVIVVFPAGTILPQGKVAIASGLGPGTTTATGSGGATPTLTYNVDSPVNVPSGTRVGLLLQKLINSQTSGATHLTVETQTANSVNIDGPTSMNFGLNSNFHLNLGNTEFGSHPCSVTIIPASYMAHSGIPMSMMNYLNNSPTYGQLAYADGDPFIGEIELFPYNFAPKGFMHADGSLLPISQNTALFSLLGTTFGGDGQTTFAIPDLTCMEPPNMQYDISLLGIFPSRN